VIPRGDKADHDDVPRDLDENQIPPPAPRTMTKSLDPATTAGVADVVPPGLSQPTHDPPDGLEFCHIPLSAPLTTR